MIHGRRLHGRAAGLLLVLSFVLAAGAAQTPRWTAFTDATRLQVTIRPRKAGPIPIGQFHSWLVRIVDRNGKPVDTARITVGGGMEGHGHGLPTAPKVTEAKGNGEYLVEGIKFTMSGEWTLVLVIQHAGQKDTVPFRLRVADETSGRAATAEPRARTWTESEVRILSSLSLRGVDAPPPAPSNRVADSARAAELGRRLFFDRRLSRNGKIACASCHQPERYFTDGLPRSQGLGPTARNAPTVVASAFQSWFYWDGRRDSLWSQALIPLEAADEMGGSRIAVIRLIAGDEEYLNRYRGAFGESPPAVDRFGAHAGPFGSAEEVQAWERQPDAVRREINQAFANVGKAIAAYERTLGPATTRFDRYVETLVTEGDVAAAGLLEPDEIAGARLFIDGGRTRCLQCHNGPMLTNGSFHNIGTGNFSGERLDFGRVFGLRAVLLDEFNCLGPYSDADPEECLELRFLNTGPHVPLEGAFKVPSLRNVAATAPYMHDGSMPSLEAVMSHYRQPPEDGGAPHELRPLDLDDAETARLIAFLECLSPE